MSESHSTRQHLAAPGFIAGTELQVAHETCDLRRDIHSVHGPELPTAPISGCQSEYAAVMVVTVCAGAAFFAMILPDDVHLEHVEATSAASTTPTETNTISTAVASQCSLSTP